MSEIRERLLAVVKVFVPEIDRCRSLVERLQDFVDEVAEENQEAGREQGWDDGYAEGLEKGRAEADDGTELDFGEVY